MGRPCHDKLRGRHGLDNLARRRDEIRQDTGDFVGPASWQNRDRRSRRGQPKPREKRAPWWERHRQIEKRMPHKLDRYTTISIDRFLEGKDHEHHVRKPTNCLEPRGAPCPNLRADVVHDRDAEQPDAARQDEVEIRKVDDDEGVRTVAAGGPHQTPHGGQNTRGLPDPTVPPPTPPTAITTPNKTTPPA